MELNKTLTINDLVTAFVENERYKNWDKSYFELKGYYNKQLEIMQNLFGYDVKEAKETINSQKRPMPNEFDPEIRYEFHFGMTHKLFEDCIRLLNAVKTPFDYSGMMEGMPPKFSRDLQKKYDSGLNQSIESLENTYRNIAMELLVFMFPGIESKQVDGAEIYRQGLPKEEPDLVDYF